METMETQVVAEAAPAPAVDKSGERVRAMFGEIAARYDAMNHLLSAGVDKYWRWRTVRLAPVEGTAPILDLCTGTGDLALAYQRAAAGKAQVIGADFCHPMLVIGRKKGEAVAGTRPRFVEADAQRLPFDDDTFQIVSVAFGLRNVSDTDQGLREMTRVCQPGGKVVVLEFSMPTWAAVSRGVWLVLSERVAEGWSIPGPQPARRLRVPTGQCAGVSDGGSAGRSHARGGPAHGEVLSIHLRRGDAVRRREVESRRLLC
jgi:ubiquinone/menaquinone biosynthesis methyltransferase